MTGMLFLLANRLLMVQDTAGDAGDVQLVQIWHMKPDLSLSERRSFASCTSRS